MHGHLQSITYSSLATINWVSINTRPKPIMDHSYPAVVECVRESQTLTRELRIESQEAVQILVNNICDFFRGRGNNTEAFWFPYQDRIRQGKKVKTYCLRLKIG